MARGWESKAVSEQIDDAGSRTRVEDLSGSDSIPDQRARNQKYESLRLSRARTLEQLGKATNQKHRDMLQRTLQALESEMDALA